MTPIALTGCRIFTGEGWLVDHAVVVTGPRITAVLPNQDLPASVTREDLGGGMLVPGFIDVQVNGGGGALLNAAPDRATVSKIVAAHRRFGTTGLLPTVITDSAAVLHSALSAVREAVEAGEPGVLGIHVEGPFIDVARKGAHDETFIRDMTDADIAQLAAVAVPLMLTVAPNRVNPAQIAMLTRAGIRVSLGHSDASFEQATEALHAGATAFTHLFNAMSQLSGRQPGMVGAALAHPSAYLGIIADGHHVHAEALRLVFSTVDPHRIMLISDAMPTAAGGPTSFELQGRKAMVHDGRLQLADGTLAGCNITMRDAVRYCVEELGLALEQALAMASLNPARFLGLEARYGRIKAGYQASLVQLDEGLAVLRTWVDGK